MDLMSMTMRVLYIFIYFHITPNDMGGGASLDSGVSSLVKQPGFIRIFMI